MINLDDITEDGGVVPDRSLSDAHSSMGGLAEMSSVPHHQTSNFAAILPDFSNMEQDYIRQAFSKTSFVSVRDLPTRFKPTATARALAAKIDANRRSLDAASVSKRNQGPGGGGVFSTFEYIPSRYSLADEIKTKERLESEAKRLDVGGRDFICAGRSKKMKYEDTFDNPEYRFPYMGDAFEGARDQTLRAKWIADAKILHGPFVPSGKSTQSGTTRILLPDMVRELHSVITEDWGDHFFEVLSTEDDNIAVRFKLSELRSERGVVAYMNVMCASNRIIDKHKLKKVLTDWNTKPGDGFLYFIFRPPWVRARAADVFFTLNPEERERK
mgnify:CR=1 FL=1